MMRLLILLVTVFAVKCEQNVNSNNENLSLYSEQAYIVSLTKSNISDLYEFKSPFLDQVNMKKLDACCLHGEFAGNNSNSCSRSVTIELKNETAECQAQYRNCCAKSKQKNLCELGIQQAKFLPFGSCHQVTDIKSSNRHLKIYNCCVECQAALLDNANCNAQNVSSAFKSCCAYKLDTPNWPDNTRVEQESTFLGNIGRIISKYF